LYHPAATNSINLWREREREPQRSVPSPSIWQILKDSPNNLGLFHSHSLFEIEKKKPWNSGTVERVKSLEAACL